jgi:hypothetical protein
MMKIHQRIRCQRQTSAAPDANVLGLGANRMSSAPSILNFNIELRYSTSISNFDIQLRY